jgi:hypothetical protein
MVVLYLLLVPYSPSHPLSYPTKYIVPVKADVKVATTVFESG